MAEAEIIFSQIYFEPMRVQVRLSNPQLGVYCICVFRYESIATVGEIRVWWRADFQSGSRVLKKGVLNLFLSISMAYNVISCQKVAENTQILKIAKFAM